MNIRILARLVLAATAALVLATAATLTSPANAPLAAQESEEIRARMEFDRLRLYSGGGVNHAEHLQIARQAVQAMAPGGPARFTPAAATAWRELGPVGTEWGGIVSGRVSAIAIHPRQPNTVYIGAAQGGVWRTDDAGVSWQPLTDGECSLAMGSIAIDPRNPQIVYAGTGEQHFSGDSYYGCGILRSADGGRSWQQLGQSDFVSHWGGARMSRIHIDPVTAGSAQSTTLLVASTFGLHRSDNSGRTWRHTLQGDALDGSVNDLAMQPGNPSVLYAAVGRGDDFGIYRSSDGGSSWINASPGFEETDEIYRINLAVAPSAPDVLYASAYNRADGAPLGGLALYRSDDGATTWRRLAAEGADCHRQCWYDMTIAVHPQDENQIHFGGIILYLSQDGGQTFQVHHPGGVHVDQHFMVFDTLSGPDVMYLANDGGVYRTTDAGASYASLSDDLAITQFYAGIGLHPSDPGVTLGGTQDNGTQRSSPGTDRWTTVVGGDGGYTAFDAEDPNTWYAETQWARGKDYAGPRKNGAVTRIGIDPDDRALFIPPLIMDPVDSRRLYFGTTKLYRTDDAAETWTPIFESDGPVVNAIAPSSSDAHTVYIAVGGWAYNGGWGREAGVHVTRDGGQTWQLRSRGLPAERYIADIAVHPHDPNQAYAVVGGFNSGHVFRTRNAGETWEDRTGNLPNMPVNAVLYDPRDANAVFVGADLGVFHSTSGGGIWTRAEGIPSVAVFDLAARPGTGRLVAATHGRGMFELPIDVPLTAGVRPHVVADTVFAATDTTVTGEVIVAPWGRNDHATAWSATTSGEDWLMLENSEGVGRGRVKWRIVADAPLLGDHAATITVNVAGLDPVSIPVAVRARHWSVVATDRTGARTATPTQHMQPVTDSLAVSFDGPRADLTTWTATRTGAGWAEITHGSGTGAGVVTWAGDVSEYGIGTYVDTVLVISDLAEGSPAVFVDTLVVQPPLSVVAQQTAGAVGMAGVGSAPSDTLLVGLAGYGAEVAVWEARTDTPWILLERASGGRDDPVVWTRSAAALEAGTYDGSIDVRVQGDPDLHGTIVERFDVRPAASLDEALAQLFGESVLDAARVEFLDWFGNHNGIYDVGDVFKWLHHGGGGGS